MKRRHSTRISVLEYALSTVPIPSMHLSEIANARDRLRAFPRRSQMHAIVCELLPGDRKCTRSFASLSQEIANVRDGLRASPRRSKSIPFIFKKILRSQFFADVPGCPGSGGQVIAERQLGSSASRAPAPIFRVYVHSCIIGVQRALSNTVAFPACP